MLANRLQGFGRRNFASGLKRYEFASQISLFRQLAFALIGQCFLITPEAIQGLPQAGDGFTSGECPLRQFIGAEGPSPEAGLSVGKVFLGLLERAFGLSMPGSRVSQFGGRFHGGRRARRVDRRARLFQLSLGLAHSRLDLLEFITGRGHLHVEPVGLCDQRLHPTD